ncbi:MAG: hypothetical protein ACT4RN_14620 [Pseudonocardia sp.]
MPLAPLRLARAAVAASTAVAVGAGAHVLGGGALPVSALVGGALPLVAALLGPMWLLAGRERAFLTITGVQLAGQQLVHAWLELDSAGAHLPPPDDVSLYGHVLAALAVAWWLRSGERRAWVAAHRAAEAMAAWWRWIAERHSPGVPVTAVPVPEPATGPVRPGAVLAHVLVRRGPPHPA